MSKAETLTPHRHIEVHGVLRAGTIGSASLIPLLHLTLHLPHLKYGS